MRSDDAAGGDEDDELRVSGEGWAEMVSLGRRQRIQVGELITIYPNELFKGLSKCLLYSTYVRNQFEISVWMELDVKYLVTESKTFELIH